MIIFKYKAVFGFAAALLEALPFIGLVFSISNQVGAAMWAHGMATCTVLYVDKFD